jgi:hypothetical protein
MKTKIILIKVAGIINILFVISHAAFGKMFDWSNSLSCLSVINRSILLTYHYICILFLGMMALISLVYAKTLLASPLKKLLLGIFALFFILRIVSEFTLFGISVPHSLLIIFLCLLPVVLFLIPVFKTSKQ